MNLKIRKILFVIILILVIVIGSKLLFDAFAVKMYQVQLDEKVLNKTSKGVLKSTYFLKKPRAGDSSILLPNGKVLIVDGRNNGAEIFNPKTGQYKLVFPKLKFAQSKIIQIDDNNVLAGGQYILDLKKLKYRKLIEQDLGQYVLSERMNNDEIFILTFNQSYIYNIKIDELKKYESKILDIYSNPLFNKVIALRLIQLDNNKILITVPEVVSEKTHSKLVFYLWDYQKDELKYLNEQNIFSLSPTIIKLDNKRVYIIGGAKDTNPLIYDIDKNKFKETSKPNKIRYYYPRAIKLKNGNIMIVGGEYNFNPQEYSLLKDMSIEFYNVNEDKYYLGPLLSRRFGSFASANITFYLQELTNGNVLISGGMTNGGHPWKTSLVYKGE